MPTTTKIEATMTRQPPPPSGKRIITAEFPPDQLVMITRLMTHLRINRSAVFRQAIDNLFELHRADIEARERRDGTGR